MSKLFKNVNWSKVGAWFGDAIKNNGGKIIGGVAMIGLGLLCKKLDVPVEILSDPFASMGTSPAKPKGTGGAVMSMLYLPTTPKQNAVAAIAEEASGITSEYYKNEAIEKIYNLVKDSKESENKMYAISAIKAISKKMTSTYYKNQALETISKIAAD